MNAIQTLLTDSLGIWSAADTAKKSGRGRASGNAGSVYGIRKLRELILELAVRGKLVPQDANDEPASALLKRIQAEKARLIAEGKIKKDKPLAPITQEEKPFALPHGWEWVRLGDVCSYIQRGKGPVYVDNSDFHVISQKCVRWTGLDLSQARFIDPESLIKYETIRMLCEGDILWNSTGTGTIGRACFIPPLDKKQILVADSHVTVVRPITFSSIFLWRWIQSPSVQSEIEGAASGTTNQIELNTSTVVSHPLPLAPLAEQHRIVAKVDELMALCDQLEARHSNAADAHEKLVSHLLGTLTQSQNAKDFSANWQRIAAHFDTLFSTEASIDTIKQTLLQLAVIGKLVPQDPNDEPANALLKRIQAEKAKLIAEGKIKKDKPLAAITDEEKLFDLPKGWDWVRFGCLPLDAYIGLDRGKNQQFDNLKYPYFKMNNILNNGGCDISNMVRVDATPSEIDKFSLRSGDFLFNTRNSRELVGKTCVIRDLPEEVTLYNNNILRSQFSNLIVPEFIDYWFRSSTGNLALDKIKSSTTNVCAIYQGNLFNFLCPIPSNKEQHRIVAKVDELMALCYRLKSRIADASQLQQKLADVMVAQAVA